MTKNKHSLAQERALLNMLQSMEADDVKEAAFWLGVVVETEKTQPLSENMH
jgi:hypothetical protein